MGHQRVYAWEKIRELVNFPVETRDIGPNENQSTKVTGVSR